MKEIEIFTLPNERYKIPTRDEFHRYYGGVLTNEDFCTDHPTGYMVDKIANAINWTKKNVRNTYQTI